MKPWSKVSLDFGSFPEGRNTVVMIDSHSKYHVVEVINSTSFNILAPVLEKVFAIFGLPEEIKTDNGPPFQGTEFKEFLEHLGIRHRRITPQWPQANGEVERFMRSLNKVLRIAIVENANPETSLQQFLREYRGMPHCTTKCLPWSFMFQGLWQGTKSPRLGSSTIQPNQDPSQMCTKQRTCQSETTSSNPTDITK